MYKVYTGKANKLCKCEEETNQSSDSVKNVPDKVIIRHGPNSLMRSWNQKKQHRKCSWTRMTSGGPALWGPWNRRSRPASWSYCCQCAAHRWASSPQSTWKVGAWGCLACRGARLSRTYKPPQHQSFHLEMHPPVPRVLYGREIPMSANNIISLWVYDNILHWRSRNPNEKLHRIYVQNKPIMEKCMEAAFCHSTLH